MKYTTYYSSVEKVVYEFDEFDIKRILVDHLKGNNDGSWEIEQCDDYDREDDDLPSGWHIELTHNIVTLKDEALQKLEEK